MQENEKVSLSDGRDIDPSALTTQMVWREVQSLKELQSNEITAVKEGIKVAHEDLVRVPTQLSTAIGGLQTLLDTKIAYESKIVDIKVGYESKIKDILDNIVNKNFERNEAMRLEYKADSSKAIELGLNAQKELSTQSLNNMILMQNKNETSMTKVVDSLASTMSLGFGNIREGMTDLKANQSTIQGSTQGKSQIWLWLFAAAAFFFGLIGTMVAIISAVLKFSNK